MYKILILSFCFIYLTICSCYALPSVPSSFSPHHNINSDLSQLSTVMSELKKLPPATFNTIIDSIITDTSLLTQAKLHGTTSFIEETKRHLRDKLLIYQKYKAQILDSNGLPFNKPMIIQSISINNNSNINETRINNIINRYLHIGSKYNSDSGESVVNAINYLGGVKCYISVTELDNDNISILVNILPGIIQTTSVFDCNHGNKYTGEYIYGITNSQYQNGMRTNITANRSNSSFKNYYVEFNIPVGPYQDKLNANIEYTHFKLGKELQLLELSAKAINSELSYTHIMSHNNKNFISLTNGIKFKQNIADLDLFNVHYSTNSYELFNFFTFAHNFDNKNSLYTNNLINFGWTENNTHHSKLINSSAKIANKYTRFWGKIDYLHNYDKHWHSAHTITYQLVSGNQLVANSLVAGGINGVRAFDQRITTFDSGIILRNELIYKFNQSWSLTGFHEIANGRNAKFGGNNITLQGLGCELDYTNKSIFVKLMYAHTLGSIDDNIKVKDNYKIWFFSGFTF